MKIYTYLNYGGNCEEAFRFYEKYLGGKIVTSMKWGQMPDAEKHMPPGYEDAVIHARMQIGETELMASDVPKTGFSQCAAYISPSQSRAMKMRSASMLCWRMAARFT